MIRRILLLLGVAVLLLVAVVLVNTFRSSPWPVKMDQVTLPPLPDSAIAHMSEAIRIQTISTSDSLPIDTSAFNRFASFLDRSYPLIQKNLQRTTIKGFSYIYEWKGQDTSLAPIILMSHYDVVPVELATKDQWQVHPFSGRITDSCIWGRGATDNKFGVISILEATEAMIKKGFIPRRSIYLCFGHDEEISGQGARAIVDYLEQKKVKAEMVLDEGGQLSENRVKEVKRPLAVIGVGEKGYASFRLSVEKEGGHSSMPAKETSIDILSAALYKLRKKSPSPRLTPQLREFVRRIGVSSDDFVSKMAASNLWLFGAVAKSRLAAEPEGDAMMHTTIVPTIVQSGIKDNVIPTHAEAIVNSRIMPGENAASVEAYIRKAIGDDRVTITKIGKYDSDPSPATSTDSPAFKRLESALYKNIPRVIPVPYMMIGATDSRYYRRISNGVLNFFPMTDAKGYHGINERLPVLDLHRGINFIMTIIQESSQEFN